ncbi:hypothetical protein [Halosimplex halobium]|uniref:hypothetical protein n=1 Tax=Halosimplex halobium TaxID=3396618 RepID=UPI003F56D7D7
MSIESTSSKESSSTGDETETVAQNQSMSSTDSDHTAVPIADLLRKETDLWFAGLTEADAQVYPADISAETRCCSSDPLSFKETIKTLPQANSGELWATNDFVTTSGEVDTDAIRRVHGLDVDALESQAGTSIEALASRNDANPVVRVHDHKDIVDERRKALNALGYDVKFRWQIASDSYTIINPQEAYLPIISALQQRGDTEVFGWTSYRDWGGLLKMVVICPSLRHVVEPPDQDLEDIDEEGITSNTQWREDCETGEIERETVVYGGFQTGYDFRGTQTLWARPILFFPDSGTVLPDTGERYTRRHYGKATDAAHERANDRVPINEWWRSIYDDIDLRMTDVDEALYRTRAITYDFEELPFSLDECYSYWGVAYKYAERAAERARAIANPSSRPTVFNIQLSLLIALLEEYEGSMASNSYQEYLEVAGELFRKPAMMIQLAMNEHDRRADDDTRPVLPDEQKTLSDSLEDLVEIPGIEVGTEVDLSDQQAQRVQNRVQKRLDESI